MLAYTYPLLDFFWTILWLVGFIIFIWLFFIVVLDVFRSHDMGGWAKAGWLVLLIVFPIVGILIYLIARGGKMAEHRLAEQRQEDQAFRAYVKDATGSGAADELSKLAELRDRGLITETEFQSQKAKVLS